MPSERIVLVFRPDEKEQDMLDFLLELKGPPTSRIVAVAVREMALREGYKSNWRESPEHEDVSFEVDETKRELLQQAIQHARGVLSRAAPVVKFLLEHAIVRATDNPDAPFDIRTPIVRGTKGAPPRLVHVEASVLDLGVERISQLVGSWVRDCVNSGRDYPPIAKMTQVLVVPTNEELPISDEDKQKLAEDIFGAR